MEEHESILADRCSTRGWRCGRMAGHDAPRRQQPTPGHPGHVLRHPRRRVGALRCGARRRGARVRSEEHTSELQSLMRISYAVFCLKKKKKTRPSHHSFLRKSKTLYCQTTHTQ